MRKTKQTISQELIDLRRHKVLEYLSTGHTSHREIAGKLHVAHDTVDRDVRYLIDNSKADIRKHIESKVPLSLTQLPIFLPPTLQ